MSKKRAKSVRLIQLEAFVEAVDVQSFTAASKVLDCHQSQASKYVIDLEKWFGAPLLVSGTTELTSAGEIFLPVARQVIDLLTESKARFAAPQKVSAPIDPKNIRI